MGYQGKLFHIKGCKELEQNTQRSGGVAIPGSVQQLYEFGTLEHGLTTNMVVIQGWWLDFMI